MPIWDHLEELRERVLVAALAAAVGIGGCFCFSKELVLFLEAPVAEAGVRFLQLSPGEFFFTTFKVSGGKGGQEGEEGRGMRCEIELGDRRGARSILEGRGEVVGGCICYSKELVLFLWQRLGSGSCSYHQGSSSSLPLRYVVGKEG